MSASTAKLLDLPRSPDPERALDRILGTSPLIEAVREQVRAFAPTWATVLVQGESGTGKELVAAALHALGPNPSGRYVTACAATFSPDLLSSELFGHARGAFTGAAQPHRGLFEQADHGTLFLDEIGELPLPAQAALLRVLETGEVRAVGAERVMRVQVRLVAATHRDLYAMVKKGTFREDLFFRLHVLSITVPPLRARLEDVLPISLDLLHRLEPEIGKRTLSLQALQALSLPAWPGNVRQLVNVVRRAAALASTPEIGLPTVVTALAAEPECTLSASDVLRPTPALILQTVERCGGNQTRAAQLLKIPRSTLRDTLHRFGIERTR